MLFTRGSGKQFVGEGVADYKKGDIALIGSNVPHFHLCDTKLNPSECSEPSAGEVLQFLPSIFPLDMERLPDYNHIGSLLQKSQYGLRFYETGLYEELRQMFRMIDGLEYTARLIAVFEILERLFRCREVKTLSETAYNGSNISDEANEPVNKVYTYLFNHFKEEIELKDIAEYVGRNPSALCRYFKRRTDKSIFRCLAEIRVEHACKLLSYSYLTVSQVAYESGYNNVPYFIKQFEAVMQCSPGEYRVRINKL